MISIRGNTFETNSSSTHSIVISNTDDSTYIPIDIIEHISSYNYLQVSLGEFGWEIHLYTNAYEKLQYILTMAYELFKERFFEELGWEKYDSYTEDEINEQFIESTEFIEVRDAVRDYINYDTQNNARIDDIEIVDFYGYIDHQSYEYYKTLTDFLRDWCVPSIQDFIFDSKYAVQTDNDNH